MTQASHQNRAFETSLPTECSAQYRYSVPAAVSLLQRMSASRHYAEIASRAQRICFRLRRTHSVDTAK